MAMEVLKLTMEAGGVPLGAYNAKLVSIEGVDPDTVRGYGAGICWAFEVVDGPHKGRKATRITAAKLTAKNKTGRFLAGMIGGLPAAGADADLAGLIGRPFLIVVAQTESGSTRVEAATPAA